MRPRYDWPGLVKYVNVCIECGKPFYPSRYDARYCGAACAMRAWRAAAMLSGTHGWVRDGSKRSQFKRIA
jgi:hypothetical protein